jgi:hypothetical protein
MTPTPRGTVLASLILDINLVVFSGLTILSGAPKQVPRLLRLLFRKSSGVTIVHVFPNK